MSRILVTGGAGFIGQHLVERLLREGHQVTVLDNLYRGRFDRPELAGARLVRGDIRDLSDLDRAIDGARVVVHLAAQSNVMGSEGNPGYTFGTNVTGTWNVARAAGHARIERLVFASSREVYGEPQRLPVKEDAPFAPKNIYGASKVAGEALLAGGAAGSVDVAVLRFANVIGPGDRGRVVPNWLSAAARLEPLLMHGGEQQLDFVPIGLAVSALVRAVDQGRLDGPVNVASGKPTTLAALAARIIQLQPGSRVQRLPARSADVVRFVADVTRMREVLELTPPDDPLASLAEFAAAS